jgi:hypothetical protein
MTRTRKSLALSMALLLLIGAAAALVAGCGGGGNSDSTAQGSASSLSASELKALVYPGAEEEDLDMRGGVRPSGGSSAPGDLPQNMHDSSAPPMSSAPGFNGGPGGGTARPGMMSAYWTSDSVDQVSAWYVEELSDRTGFEERTVPSRGGSGDAGEDASIKAYSCKVGETTVMVMLRTETEDRGGTVITIGEAPEGMPSSPRDAQSQ